MAYKLTPEQYKDAAVLRISNKNTAENTNSAVSAYARALNSRRALDNKNVQNKQAVEAVEVEDDDSGSSGNWFVRTFSTIAAPVLRATEGLAKFAENAILDFGAGVTATVLDWAGADNAAEEVQDFAKKDLVGEAFDWALIQDIYNNSWSNEWGGFGEILQEGIYTIGQQAIPFALNFIPGGQVLSPLAFGMGAYGGGFEGASQDGGSVLGSSAYGALSAALETAIESIGGWKLGKTAQTAVDKVASKVAKGKLGELLGQAITEGGEEVISGMFDNYLRAMSYKGDYSSVGAYFKNLMTTDPATFEELLEQFTLGAVAGGMMGGVQTAVRRFSPTMNASETIQEAEELREKAYNLNLRGRDTSAVEQELLKKENALVEIFNKNRNRFEKNALEGRKTTISLNDYMTENFNRDENGNFTTSKNVLVHNENVSYGVGEAELQRALGDRAVVHQEKIEGEAATTKGKVERAIRTYNKVLGKSRLNLVVADIQQRDGDKAYGYVVGNTVVIDASSLNEDVEFFVREEAGEKSYKVNAAMSTLLHEVVHFTDDTKAGKELRKLLKKYAVDNETDALGEAGMLEMKAMMQGKSFDFDGELSARQLENLLFNEKIIRRLTEDNSSLVKRILNKLTRFWNALKGEKLAETKELEKLLGKAVKLYNKAIAQKGKGKGISVKGIDNQEEIEYSRRTTKYISYEAVGKENIQSIREQLTKLYDGVNDGIANGVAIENGDTIYIIDSGKDNGKLSFGIRKRIKISDNERRVRYIKNINKESAENGYGDRELFEKLGVELDNDSRSNVGRKAREDSSSDTRKPENHQEGISDEVKYSRRITDSNGNTLTPEQTEFFKNSKAVDKNGNLQVVYHGTEGEFYIFDKSLRGSTTGAPDAKHGFFFTSSKEVAMDYAEEAKEMQYFVAWDKVLQDNNKKYREITNKDYFYRDIDVETLPEPYRTFGRMSERVDQDDYDIMEMYLNIENPLEVDFENKKYQKAAMYKALVRAKAAGNDGLIVRNIDDTTNFSGKISDVFVVFEPNQIKLTSNKKPKITSDDIRYSRRVVNREELRQAIEDTVEMLTAVSSIDENKFDVSAPNTALSKKYLAEVNELLAKGKLTISSKPVRKLVDSIFDGAIMTEQYDDLMAESAITLSALRKHLHSINLSTDSIKPEIQNQYGKTNGIFCLWGSEDGVAWDKAVQEIVAEMPQLERDSDIETLFNIFDTYTRALADVKQVRKQVSEAVKNVDEAKKLMARQLVNSLSASGTELVTKLTADKLQEILAEERNAVRETIRAIKTGKADVTFVGESISLQTREQLQGVIEAVAQERAKAYAQSRMEDVARHLKKNITLDEIGDMKKTDAYQALADYIAERYLQDGKAVTIKSIEEQRPALAQAFKRAVSSVRNIRATKETNVKVIKALYGADYKLLKQRISELSLDETHLKTFETFENALDGLFKPETADGKRPIMSYDDLIKTGALLKAVQAFDTYFTNDNPALQDLIDSGSFEEAQKMIKAYKGYLQSLSGENYSDMSIADKQVFNNTLNAFLAEVSRATKATTNITVNGESVSAKKYRDKALRGLEMSAHRDKSGNYRAAKRAMAAFWSKYMLNSVRPYEAIALAENHSGFLETLFNEVRAGYIQGENARADLEDMIFSFVTDKENRVSGKKYVDHLINTEVKIEHSNGDFAITKAELLGLYLTLIQEDGFRHADAANPMGEGIYFEDKKSTSNYRNDTALKFTAENVAKMETLLNDTDLRFIESLREFFKEAGKLKGEVDMKLYGIERLLGDEYYPLQTDESARSSKLGDKVSFYDALDPSGHLSINQSRTSGLKALRVRSVLDVVTTYAKSVGLYYGVAVPVADMRLVYNSKGINGDSMKDFIAKHYSSDFDTYLDKLLLDVQGAIKVADSFLERQRQRYATFAIAANIKSPIKALGGLFSLTGKLKTTSFLKGLVQTPFKLITSGRADFSQMYEYCPATRMRYRDKQATLAAMNMEGSSRKKNWLVDKLAIGIELVDKYTVYVAWNSAKAEVGAVGANANNPELLKKAGQLLNETLDTIDRFEMTERNEFSRSEDSFRRGLAMFTSSAQAQLTQFVDKTSRLSELYYMKKHLPGLIETAEAEKIKLESRIQEAEKHLKNAEKSGDAQAAKNAGFELKQAQEKLYYETSRISELKQKQLTIEGEIKKAKVFAQKAIVSISLAIVASAALSQLMSNLMGDKDEEEWGEAFTYGMLDESLANVFGMLPAIGQFYNAIEFELGDFEKKSYDMSFWVIDEWNMIADALGDFVALIEGVGTKTPARVARDLLYAIGQWFGIPTRNLFNVVNTALKAVPTLDYQWDNLFVKGNYGSDLKKAIDAGDTELADTIVRLMMKDTFGDSDTNVVKTVRGLYEQGYTHVIPKTVSSSIKINGETYSMTSKQQKAFKAIYAQADTTIERLIGKQSFKSLSAKVQADSIKWIYDYYYEKAKEHLSGIEDDGRKALFGTYIPIETLAVAYCTARSLEADTDKKGNAIAGTKKAKVAKYLNSIKASAAEKYMILGYLGYSPVSSSAATLITSFARKNGASGADIQELLSACNIAAA